MDVKLAKGLPAVADVIVYTKGELADRGVKDYVVGDDGSFFRDHKLVLLNLTADEDAGGFTKGDSTRAVAATLGHLISDLFISATPRPTQAGVLQDTRPGLVNDHKDTIRRAFIHRHRRFDI